MVVQAKPPIYTPEEYLALEETSETKHEYCDGTVVEMTGGSTDHNRIIINLIVFLTLALRGTEHSLFTSDVRLWIPEYNRYTYPDIQVISGEIAYFEARKDTLINPSIIIEVLSESTQNYDRGDKFKFYRSLPAFQEYIVIDQYQYGVEQYIKVEGNKWEVVYLESESSVLSFKTLDSQVSLADIYDKVSFPRIDTAFP